MPILQIRNGHLVSTPGLKLRQPDPCSLSGVSKLWPNLHTLSAEFYWNTAMAIRVHTVYGYFSVTKAEVNSCKRAHMASESKIFIIWDFAEKLCQPLLYSVLQGLEHSASITEKKVILTQEF